MSDREQKDMSGVLFRVKEKQSDKHPDFDGNIVIHGEKFYLSAWLNESKNGVKYLALKASEPREQRSVTASAPAKPKEDKEELPF